MSRISSSKLHEHVAFCLTGEDTEAEEPASAADYAAQPESSDYYHDDIGMTVNVPEASAKSPFPESAESEMGLQMSASPVDGGGSSSRSLPPQPASSAPQAGTARTEPVTETPSSAASISRDFESSAASLEKVEEVASRAPMHAALAYTSCSVFVLSILIEICFGLLECCL